MKQTIWTLLFCLIGMGCPETPEEEKDTESKETPATIDSGMTETGAPIDAGAEIPPPVIDSGIETPLVLPDAGTTTAITDAGLFSPITTIDSGTNPDAGFTTIPLQSDAGTPTDGPIIDSGTETPQPIADAGWPTSDPSIDAGFDAGTPFACESGTQDNDDDRICLPACALDSCAGDLLCNDSSGAIVCQCPAGQQDNNSDEVCVALCSDSDADLDDVCAATDNCPDTSNLSQVDTDGDGMGDVCDPNPEHHQDDINFILDFAAGCGATLDTEGEILSFGGQMWQAYRLTELELMEQGFSGCGIPASLGQVSALRILLLPGNNLEGIIPETITWLEDLFILDLRDNLLTGPIPGSWNTMPGIETIDLQNNALSGPIPDSLGNLTSLEFLLLHNNQLSGAVPSTLGNLSVLKELKLDHNQLSGVIPDTLGNLDELVVLDLSFNELLGPAPESICNLVSRPAFVFNVTNNHICGPHPSCLADLMGEQDTSSCTLACDDLECGDNAICEESSGSVSCSCIAGYATNADGDCELDYSTKIWGSYATRIRMNRTGTVYGPGVISAEVNPSTDFERTLQALVDTHQKMYGVGAQSDGALRDLEYLLDFIEAKEDDSPFKDIKIFAGVGERHLGKKNRWLDGEELYELRALQQDCDEGVDAEAGFTCYGEHSKRAHDEFLSAWQNAARELSILAKDHEQLEGLNIDDIGAYVCSPELNIGPTDPDSGYPDLDDDERRYKYCFTQEDLRSIVAAARCDACDSDFKIWPTAYMVEDVPRYVAQAHTIGQRSNGVVMHNGERVFMRINFTLGAATDAGQLQYVYSDLPNEEHEAPDGGSINDIVFHYVNVNGDEVFEDGLFGKENARFMDKTLTFQEGENFIEIGLKKAGAGSLQEKLLYVWGLGLLMDGAQFHDFEITYDAINLEGESQLGKAQRHFVAEQSDVDLTSGDESTYPIAGFLSPNIITSKHYDNETYAQVLQRTKAYLPDRDFITVSYGQNFGVPIDSKRRTEEIITGLTYSDRVLVWNFPMPIHYLNERKGIFDNTSGPEHYGGNWDFMSFWPNHEQCMESWYETWTADLYESITNGDLGEDADGNLNVLLYLEEGDAHKRLPLETTLIFRTTLIVQGSEERILFDSNWTNADDTLRSTEATELLLGPSERTLVLKVENIAECGGATTNKIKLRLRASEPDSGEVGTSEVVNWQHSTGTTQTEIPELYCEATEAMHELLAPPDAPAWPPDSLDECLEYGDYE